MREVHDLRAFVWGVLAASVSAWAVEARASQEWDQKYRLSTVAVLRLADNVDGLFNDTIQSAVIRSLTAHRRFKVVDAQPAEPVLGGATIPYSKLIEDTDVLRLVAARIGAETLIRGKIVKRERELEIKLDWLHAPRIQVLSTESWTLPLPAPGEGLGGAALQRSFDQHVSHLIDQIPAKGLVTGRDRQTLTLGMGRGDGVHAGDIVTIGTLERVDTHPLYQTLENWSYLPSGRVRIVEVAQDLAFAEIIEESPSLVIARDHSVIKIEAEPKPVEQVKVEKVPESVRGAGLLGDGFGSFLGTRPTLGWVAVEAWLGSISRQYGATGALTGTQGGGLLLGGRLETQVWLTRELFVEAGLGYGFTTYSQKLIETGAATLAGGVSASLVGWNANVGYQLFLTPNFWGPRLFGRLGYRSKTLTLPISDTELTGPFTVGSIYLGIGFELPVHDWWGVLASGDIGVFRSATLMGWNPGAPTGANDLTISIGPYLRLSSNVTVRAQFVLESFGAGFADLAALSALSVRFVPTLQVFF